MNKFKYSLNKKIYAYIFFSILVICFSTLYYFLKSYNTFDASMWDFIYYMNSNYYNIIFSYTTITIFFFMYIYNHKEKYNSEIIRYRSVNRWIDSELVFIFSCVFIFIITLITIQMLIGSSIFKIENCWTGTLNFNDILNVNLDNTSPILANIYNIILLYLYLVLVGIITFISCIKINNKLLTFLISNSLGLISIWAYYSDAAILFEISILKNIVMQQLSREYLSITLESFKSFLYWITIITLMIVAIKKIIFKFNDIYFKKENDSV